MKGVVILNYYWPILLIITSNVCYHISAKSMPGTINPLASLVTYIVAAIATFLLYFNESGKEPGYRIWHLNWTPFLLALPCGFGIRMSMYKVGWNISIGSLVCNIASQLYLL